MRRRRVAQVFSAWCSRRAFTLVEMLTVIAIIGVLAGLIIPAVISAIRNAKITRCKSEIANLKTGIDMYYSDWGYYPPDSMEPNPTTMTLSDLTHPSTPAECLIFFLGTRFTPSSTNGKVSDNVDLTGPEYGNREAYGNKTRGPYTEFRGEQLAIFRPGNWPAFVDPWGQPYLYNAPGGLYGNPKHNTASYDIFSVGPNGLTAQAALNIRSYLTQTDLGWESLINNNDGGTPPQYRAGNDVDPQRGGNAFIGRYGYSDADDINSW